MIAIKDDRINFQNNKFIATCACGKVSAFSCKNSALKMLNNQRCRYCFRKYVSMVDKHVEIFKVGKKWGKKCSGCNCDQLYTRMDHAKQSFLSDWQCKKCVSASKGFCKNSPVGDRVRVFNKFKKSSISRQIYWDLSVDDLFDVFSGNCALTGWPISISYKEKTASLDRIDSSKGYIVGNIQWVHTMVNMSKNKYSQEKFVHMCFSVFENLNKKG